MAPKSHGLEHDNPANTSAPSDPTSRTRIGTYGEENFNVDDDDFDFDDDDFAEEMSTEWNLRKCTAAALDVLAVGDVLVFLLDPLKAKLWRPIGFNARAAFWHWVPWLKVSSLIRLCEQPC
jgi:transportin-1